MITGYIELSLSLTMKTFLHFYEKKRKKKKTHNYRTQEAITWYLEKINIYLR